MNMMNHKLNDLHPYPFAKMATLLADSSPAPDFKEIKLGIGEPKHAPPAFVLDVLTENLDKIANYPTTNGIFELRQTIAHWLEGRFMLHHVHPNTQVLPVMGTREAIFSSVQAIVNLPTETTGIKSAAASAKPLIVMPNPFYQIYEGAALLAGAEPYFVPCTAANNFKGDYRSIPAQVWEHTQMVFVCSPNNPTGAVMSFEDWEDLLRLSDRYGFIIASDECYSELYFDTPPVGLLQACAMLGRHDFKNCLVFHSLSKRSNLPGLRSGFVAGDAQILAKYLQYRTYHGCAMPIPHQLASIAAWQDENHVRENRRLYAEKFALWMTKLGDTLALTMPDAGFYLWVRVPASFTDAEGELDDEAFVRVLFEQANIHALAGRYLSREVEGVNPGKGYVRIALVASLEENQEAIDRIKALLAVPMATRTTA
jgi:N-succinyldiaminopimelate aminotransferase